MIIDTGYRCHELTHLGLLPFAITEDYTELYNQQGYSGPCLPINESNAAISGFSGILGPGTPYPVSGTIDQITRQFWGVKSWNLTVKVSRIMSASSVECPIKIYDPFLPFPPFMSFFNYCSIGAYAGEQGSIPPPMVVISKTLTMQDYCSHSSNNSNKDRTGSCPYNSYSGINPNTQVCCATNPIQKFNDLLCRTSYGTWSATEEDWRYFETGNIRDLRYNPYIDKSFQFRVYSNPGLLGMYDCPDSIYYEDVYSMFSLSIMDSHGFVPSGSCTASISGYIPDTYDYMPPFSCYGKSGEVLTSSYGDITGYGINKKPSGVSIPLVYDAFTGISNNFPITGIKTFFPLINFNMQMRTNSTVVSNSNLCPVKDRISSIRQRAGQKRVGELIIRDFVSGLGSPLDKDLAIMKVPLFATTTTNSAQFYIEATLQPQDTWVTNSLSEKY